MPAADVDAQLRAMRRISLVALAVGVPLAMLVAWMSTAPLARRVQAMAGAAKAFKAGDLGARAARLRHRRAGFGGAHPGRCGAGAVAPRRRLVAGSRAHRRDRGGHDRGGAGRRQRGPHPAHQRRRPAHAGRWRGRDGQAVRAGAARPRDHRSAGPCAAGAGRRRPWSCRCSAIPRAPSSPAHRPCPATAAAAPSSCCTTSATSAASIGCGRTSSPTCRTSCGRR